MSDNNENNEIKISLMNDDSFNENYTQKVIKKYKVGRKSLYDESFPQIAYEIMKSGYSINIVGKKLGVSRKTIDQWLVKYPEFKDAIENGIDHEKAYWEEYAHGRKDDSQILKLILSEKLKWAERNKNETTVGVDHVNFLKSVENQIMKFAKDMKTKGEEPV